MKQEKIKRLTSKARFDRERLPIYPAQARGRTIPLFKTLLRSDCQNDCKFCVNRYSRQCHRYSMEPEEFANAAMKLHERRKVQGVFLSSALSHDPEFDSRREVEAIKMLRENGYTGYVHLRLMPGCSLDTIKQAAKVADRLGINLEAPNSEIYNELKVSDVFDYKTGVLKRMKWISRTFRNIDRSKPWGALRAGIDTQFIVGATQDHDRDYLQVTEELYQKFGLQRVYYSGFEPVPRTPLTDHPPCSRERVYRLYQASFLLRDYGFAHDDLIYEEKGNLLPEDPKMAFAEAHEDLFPVEINSAPYERLLLVPGIGPATARKILKKRPIASLTELETIRGRGLKKMLKFIELPHLTLRNFIS